MHQHILPHAALQGIRRLHPEARERITELLKQSER
jgi:hypothetical protein